MTAVCDTDLSQSFSHNYHLSTDRTLSMALVRCWILMFLSYGFVVSHVTRPFLTSQPRHPIIKRATRLVMRNRPILVDRHDVREMGGA